ncbi:MAG TPA: LysM peptidoglycan-binding domain-containing protein [Anaerolineales bacterium]|nr:LysM peptidoglycan-binding domain-containing protein [Anaerolineales bacterium]
MNIQRFLRYGTVIALVMVLAVALSGCLRAASEGITDTTDTTGSSYPVPGATDQNMGELGTLVAQTEAAQQTPGMPPATQQPVVNPEVPAVTETPQPVPPEQQPQPTAAPVVYIEATAGAPPATYTLQPGEFPFCIARRFNVDQYELLNINGLGLSSNVYPGTTLKIPQTGNTFAGENTLMNHPTTYKIKAGDTIYSIACAFGDVSPDMIALQNNLQAPYSLTAGDVLIIP